MTRQERGIRTRQLILEAAGAVFAERGFDGATISGVYQRVGVTKGAFYFHFSSKEELAREVLAARCGPDHHPLVPRQVKLQELVDVGMVFAHTLRYDTLLQGGIRLSTELSARGMAQCLPSRGWITYNLGVLKEAGRRGELQAHVDLAATAELLVGSLFGVQALSHALCGRMDLEDRVSVLLTHVLPTVAVPDVMAKLDVSPGRGSRVLAEATHPVAV